MNINFSGQTVCYVVSNWQHRPPQRADSRLERPVDLGATLYAIQTTSGLNQRGRQDSNIATDRADPETTIAHTSTAMEG